ncbi:MAG: hypothetical protein LBM60_00635 [Clostridium sp.]|jgi:uncharacterized protein with FMN-binding domain|nr:hypothetical protein [Clostridium sp.]
MSSKTKIVVLHMKELIYTGIFAALGILFIVLLIIMFKPDKEERSAKAPSGPSQTDTLPSDQATDPSDVNTRESDAVSQVLDESASPVLSDTAYIPGIYTTELVLNEQIVDVEVIVNRDYISSIRLVNLSEAVTTMYPLLQPTFDALCEQIYETQSLENISYQSDSKYTSLVLLQAIRNSLEKAAAGE